MNLKGALTMAAVSAVAVASLTGCDGIVGSITMLRFIPVEGQGLAQTLKASGDPVPDYTFPAGRPGTLEVQFGGPQNNGTGLTTCTLSWDNVGENSVTPIKTSTGGYVLKYQLPGGVNVGTNSALLKCPMGEGKDYTLSFSLTGTYEYMYWTTGTGVARTKIGDPSSTELTFITGFKEVTAVAVYDNTIFFSNSKGIGRADLDGSNVKADAVALGMSPSALTVWSYGTGAELRWVGPRRDGKLEGLVLTGDSDTVTAVGAGSGWLYSALLVEHQETSFEASNGSSRTYPRSIPMIVTGIADVKAQPYWTSLGSIYRFQGNKPQELVALEPDNLEGLAFSGRQLLTVMGQSSPTIRAVDLNTWKEAVRYQAPGANGGIAVGGGYSPTTTIEVQDSQGKSATEITATYNSDASSLNTPLSFTVVNTGEATLDFSAPVDPTNYHFTGGAFSVQVPAKGSTQVRLFLSLPEPGTYKTVIPLIGNIYPDGAVNVPVTVTWTRPAPPPPPPPPAPIFSSSPAAVDFGDVAVGFPTGYRPVEVKNIGNAAMTIPAGGVTITGDASNFDFTPGTCDDVTLQATESCTAEVLYAPQTLGNHTASLQVVTNASGSPHQVPLSGTGVEPALSFTPDPIPDVDTDGPAVWGTVSVVNNSGSAVQLLEKAVTLTGDAVFSIKKDECSETTLYPAQSCSIEYWFSPGAGDPFGSFYADLTVTHGGVGSPLVVPITGTYKPPV